MVPSPRVQARLVGSGEGANVPSSWVGREEDWEDLGQTPNQVVGLGSYH